mgnify:CR=1 FL=1
MIVNIDRSKTISTGIGIGYSNTEITNSMGVNNNSDRNNGANFVLNSSTLNRIVQSITNLGFFNLGNVGNNFYVSMSALENNGNVKEDKLSFEKNLLLRKLINNFYLIPTNKSRNADQILNSIKDDPASKNKIFELRKIAKNFLDLKETREYVLENIFHESVKESWEIKKNMSGIIDDDLYSQLKKIQNIPHNWIRLIGAGMGGYFLISSKVSQDEVLNLANSNNIKFLSKANLSDKGAHAFKI